MDKSLTTREPQELAVLLQPTPMELLKAALQGGITEQNITVVERMAALAERFEQRNAEKDFTIAFNTLQSELPTIVAETVIPNRGKYAKFEDVMHQIQPFLTKHGFTVSFSNDFRDGRIIETCTLKHISGHSQTSSYAVRVSGKADSETQADTKAGTTAKRKALQDALNIVIRQDCLNEEQDATLEGDPNAFLPQAQADELEKRVALLGERVNRVAFFKFAGASTFAGIPASKYAELDAMLQRKEAGRA